MLLKQNSLSNAITSARRVNEPGALMVITQYSQISISPVAFPSLCFSLGPVSTLG